MSIFWIYFENIKTRIKKNYSISKLILLNKLFTLILNLNVILNNIILLFLLFLGSFTVLFCRIYNGVHSPADVVTGSLLGVLIVTFMTRFDNAIDLSSVMNSESRLLYLFIYLFCILFWHDIIISVSCYIIACFKHNLLFIDALMLPLWLGLLLILHPYNDVGLHAFEETVNLKIKFIIKTPFRIHLQ